MRILVQVLLVANTLFVAQSAYSWGARGHEIIAQVGSEQSIYNGANFFSANEANMVTLATVPDRLWKQIKQANLEKPTHWFQIDAYAKSPAQYTSLDKSYQSNVQKYGQDMVIKNGTALWRAQQLFNLGVRAIQQRDLSKAVQMAGAMTHYVGDLSQPLHVTTNYDGQETNQTGIHAYFETTLVDQLTQSDLQDVVNLTKSLMNDRNFLSQFTGDLGDIMLNEIIRSINLKDEILAVDKQYGRGNPQGDQLLKQYAKKRLADGSATLAIILANMWAQAGNLKMGGTVQVTMPEWVPPQYDDVKMMCMNMRLEQLGEDDCMARSHHHN